MDWLTYIVLAAVLAPAAYMAGMALLGAYLDNLGGLWIGIPMIFLIIVFTVLIA